MKYFLIVLILIFIGCSNEPKKQETVLVDTILPARTPPPFQIVAEKQASARALAAEPIPLETAVYFQKRTDGKYDTVVRTRFDKTQTETVSVTYPEWTEVIKPYKEPTTPVPPLPANSYLNFKESGPIDLTGQTGKTIEKLRIKATTGTGIGIQLRNASNITIRKVYIDGATNEAIIGENCTNITIDSVLIARATTGVYFLASKGIRITNSQGVNFRQRSTGGRGQFIQLNACTGAGNIVENNRIVNYLGESNPEDVISLYKCSGTAASPIICRNNFIWGGGPSTSGGGIMTGDNGGSYQIVENNVLLDPGQYGIAASGGTNINLINNKIYARQQPFTNNPLYVWAQAGAACSNISVKGNRVNWTDKNGMKNNGWNAGNCSNTLFEPPTTISLEQIQVLMPNPFITFADVSLIRK